jgi:CheY-like chemotaxis protein
MGTILVIDDQEPIRTLLRATLEGAGHEVLEASNGLLGPERYRERAADLIIIDMLMPDQLSCLCRRPESGARHAWARILRV